MGIFTPISEKIENPGKPWWPHPDVVTEDMEGPMPRSLLPCGCYIRQPDYEAVLCEAHLEELNV